MCITKMPTEAKPRALLLLGLITVMVTALPGPKPVLTTVQNTSTVALPKDAIVVAPDTQEDRLRRFQQSCLGKQQAGKDCLAYQQLMRDMANYSFGSNDTDLIFRQELSRTVTPQEDLCSNLTELMNHLPPQLMNIVLKPFKQVKHCVIWCYQKQGVEESTLKDSCRLLYVGYRTLVQSIKHPSMLASAPEQQQSGNAIAGNQQTNLPRDQNKSFNATINGDNAPVNKIIPNASNIQHGDTKIAAAVDPKTNEAETVAKETNKQEQIVPQKPQEPPAIPPQETLEKNGNDGDADPDGDDDANTFEEEPKDENPTQDVNDQFDSNESGRSSETINGIPNVDDSKPLGNLAGKESAQEKVRPQGEERTDQVEGSRTSDIMQGSDPFYNQNDSNFFSYFLFAMFSCAILYVAYHNKSKLMALVVEGRRTNSGRGGFSKGRKHTAAYRKLDSNLEEAITSGSTSGGHSSSQIIY